ncbi:MAG: hypothetical protein ACK4TA_03645 [Saprospiraceae bacterium]
MKREIIELSKANLFACLIASLLTYLMVAALVTDTSSIMQFGLMSISFLLFIPVYLVCIKNMYVEKIDNKNLSRFKYLAISLVSVFVFLLIFDFLLDKLLNVSAIYIEMIDNFTEPGEEKLSQYLAGIPFLLQNYFFNIIIVLVSISASLLLKKKVDRQRVSTQNIY